MTTEPTSPTGNAKASDQPIVTWLRGVWSSGRQIVALIFFVAAFTIFAVPCLVAMAVFALSVIVCLSVIAAGCVIGGVVAIPALVITPDGVKTIVEAAKESA